MPSAACIIVNYKNTEDTLATLGSLTPIYKAEDLTVIVVDNASTPETVGELKSFAHFPIELIESKKNCGFAGGVNLGIEKALATESQYIWLLNNDTVVDSNCLSELMNAAEMTDAGIIGSLIYYYPEKDKIWYAGGSVYRPWFVIRHRRKGKTKEQVVIPEGPEEVSFVTGCSMLIRREIIEQTGGLDEELFLYAEDIDLCIKAQKLGYSLYFQPAAVVWHKVSQSSGGEFNLTREYYNTRNSFVMISRHTDSLAYRILGYSGRLFWDLYRTARSLERNKSSPFRAFPLVWKAVSDFRHGRLGPVSSVETA